MMGCRCAKEKDEKKSQDPQRASPYVALAILQANRAAALMATDLCGKQLEADLARRLIRRAKNDGSTVSIFNGSLYLDYKFVGYLPAGFFQQQE